LGKVIRPENPEEGYRKLWHVTHAKERLRLDDALELSTHGVQFDTEYVSVAARRAARTMPLVLSITDDLLELLGFYIAEGHAEDRYFMISCQEPDLQRRLERCLVNLGLTWSVRSNGYDYVIAWSLYARLLREWCGATSKEKRLPDFWPDFSRAQLSRLLAAYFAGDGGVGRCEVTTTTASAHLASQLAYALTHFGLWPRLALRNKRATNSRHEGDLYYRVSISGQEQLSCFTTHINFLSRRKSQQLAGCLGKKANTNVDLIPISGRSVRHLRTELGWSQTALASRVGCARSALSLIESEHRRPSRTLFAKLMKAFEDGIVQQEQWALSQYARYLRSFAQVRWTRVSSLSQEPSRCQWVYDLSVADHETFLAGFGGLFVHNTFTMAHTIANVNRPTLVISHNKTLAAQLYSEFKNLFPYNAVEYFVSYYDYYQPEAYVPQTDTYIEKDASINDDLDRLRLSATSSLLSRRDVIIVSSVSCIYNLGDPEEYKEQMTWLAKGQTARRDEILSWLIGIHYTRNDVEFHRGTFRARGDIIDVYPAYRQTGYRIELEANQIARIREIHPLTAETIVELDQVAIYPAKHFLTNKERVLAATESIQRELLECARNLQARGKLLEAQRLESRTKYDLEMLRELGYCHGVENYSRHLSGRPPGSRPSCLIDYFPKDYLLLVDESHVTIPQIRGMYEGDRARKEILVEYGFRLPSALENRPQTFEEFESLLHQAIFISATPGPYEWKRCEGRVVEQVIRPTGLVDPTITVKPTEGQIDDLIEQVRVRAQRTERVLVTTLTKRLSEDLTRYLADANLRVKYLHSDIEAIERVEILQDLRRGEFDCLIGINLLREGLDLPEVSLVAVLDADKEGFLRSATSLIQVAGRAARNVNGEVILYADRLTGAIRHLIEETSRRRTKQLEYNRQHNITPTTIKKAILESIESARQAERYAVEQSGQSAEAHDVRQVLAELESEMLVCAQHLQFERAALLRDEITSLKTKYHLADEPTRPSRKRPTRRHA